jgi:GH25 family lysozyme M1 (1,4-beta-N-acetylmuramidase)/LysM repeat protein
MYCHTLNNSLAREGQEVEMEGRSTANFRGIDVSKYQGSIDFKTVKNAGVQVVFMKATEGSTYTDPFLRQNYEGAKAVGLKVGFYHFANPKDETKARAEAQYFASVIKDMPADCKYALDLEKNNGIDKATLSGLAKVFLDEVKRLTSHDVAIYTCTSFAKDNLTGILAGYPLWIAHYGVAAPGDNGIWTSWVGFQYSSSGTIPGIRGLCDMDEFTPGILLDGVSPQPQPVVRPVQPQPQPTQAIIYTVQPGDTLSGIAAKYHTTFQQLAAINGIANPNKIYAGQRIKVTGSAQPAPQQTYYVVKTGDTLSGIAAKYGTSYQHLAAINGITDPNKIHAGQKLLIK